MILQHVRLKGYTVVEIAKIMEMPRRTLYDKIKHPIRLSRAERRKLCRLLGIKVAELEQHIKETSL